MEFYVEQNRLNVFKTSVNNIDILLKISIYEQNV